MTWWNGDKSEDRSIEKQGERKCKSRWNRRENRGLAAVVFFPEILVQSTPQTRSLHPFMIFSKESPILSYPLSPFPLAPNLWPRANRGLKLFSHSFCPPAMHLFLPFSRFSTVQTPPTGSIEINCTRFPKKRRLTAFAESPSAPCFRATCTLERVKKYGRIPPLVDISEFNIGERLNLWNV